MNVSKRRWVGSGSLLPGGLLLGGLSMSLPSASGSIYSLTNIGAAVANATGATKSFGYALNDSGTVVGTESPDSSNVPYSVYQYSGGAVSVISNSAPNFFYAESYMAINNAGTVAYTYGTGASDQAAIFSPATGQTTSVPDQGNGVTATGINSAGTVVGTLHVPYSSSYSTSQAYVLQNAVQTNVGAQFSGATANATNYGSAINDSGQIAGIGVVQGTNGIQQAYIATPNGSTGTYTFNNVGALVAAKDVHYTSPGLTAINNAGWAVGTFYDYSGDIPASQGSGPFAYLYNGSKIVYMYGLGGTSYIGVTPTAINNSGQIVGTSSLASARYSTDAFLYQNGNTQDLNNLLDSSGAGWTLTNATGINSSGQIVGYGTYNSSGTVCHRRIPADPRGRHAHLEQQPYHRNKRSQSNHRQQQRHQSHRWNHLGCEHHPELERRINHAGHDLQQRRQRHV